MIGIIGYGMVGKAVAKGFSKTSILISDPEYNDLSIQYICSKDPEAIFVCVPTPTDDSNYAILKDVLNQIRDTGYKGLTVVKSTVLAHHLEGYDVIFNPEFLSRATAEQDFVRPVMLVFGGSADKTQQLEEVYKKYSTVETDKVYHTDIATATLLKYSFNTFYAVKVTYMNALYDIAEQMGADYTTLASMMQANPWMGTHHFQVPGPDGQRGFGGPCLPKDTEALAKQFNVPLLDTVLLLNKVSRR